MVTYKLLYPIDYDGQKITEIVLQRPKGRHIKGVSVTPTFKDFLDIAVKVSGQPSKVFDEMDAADCMAIGEIIGNFILNGREITEKS